MIKLRIDFLAVLLLLAILLFVSASFNIFAYADTVTEKHFHQLTQDEKDRVLKGLIDRGIVPNTIKVNGKTYSLNISNWDTRGVIVYGNTAAVNAANQNTTHPNYKDGHWRYLGYDMNGGLYGNDDFPPDYPEGNRPENKNWLRTTDVRESSAARNLIGNSTVNANNGFGNNEKLDTAALFLAENPAWTNKGWTKEKITEYFFFNAVISENGLTQGQFVGVHDLGGGVLRYQTFSVQAKVKFVVPPPEPIPEPVLPTDPDPDIEEPEVTPPPSGADIGINCELGLPEVTYVRHPTLASDYSAFNVGGEIWSAQRTYAEGLARNKFRTIGGSGSTVKISDIKAEVLFQSAGHHQVELEVTTTGGGKAIDTKAIEVKPTPAIIHSLSGVQKQNRKQVLNLKIAKSPGSILDEYWIKLEYPEKEDSVTLYHNINGSNGESNSDFIKTRPIERLPASNDLYEYCKLEFMIKNTQWANCRYTVFVKDDKGNFDKVVEDFTVSPDRPPDANISLDGSFLRRANSNVAEAIVEDISVTDGDQVERTWYYRTYEKEQPTIERGPWILVNNYYPGYMDYSFGTGKKIGFPKVGVGLFEVKLVAKDLWTEETLPEYVTESDRLSSEVTSSSEVINMAPVVSLEPITARTADITILAGGDIELNRAMENRSKLQTDLLQKGIDARIKVEKMMPIASENAGSGAVQTLQLKTPFGYQGNWTFYEDSNYLVDDDSFYKIDATWVRDDLEGYPQAPFIISCWDFDAIDTNDTKWTYTFTDSTFNIPTYSNEPYLSQDYSGKYLFLVSEGKTLVVTKDNGSKLAVLNMEVGKNTYVENDNIYTFKNDGVYKIQAASCRITKIYNGAIMKGEYRKIGGKVHFVTGNTSSKFRGIFDPETEKIHLEPLLFSHSEYGLSNHTVLGIDYEGKIIVNTSTKPKYSSGGSTGEFSSGNITRAHIYGRDNSLLFETPAKQEDYAGQITVAPIYDEGGICNYIAHTWDSKSSSARWGRAQIYRISDGYTQTGEIKGSKNDYPTASHKLPFAREIEDQVYICNGAEWVYVWNTGYHIYRERMNAFVFNPTSDTVRTGNHYNELGITLDTFENGYSSDVLAALQAGYNQSGNSYSLNQIIKWNQTLQKILNRYVVKHFKGEKDLNFLVIYDETNPTAMYSDSLKSQASSAVSRQNGKLIIAGREDITDGGLYNAIIAEENQKNGILAVSVPEGKIGTLSKSYRLKPDKTYYYEYDIKRADGKSDDAVSLVHECFETPGAQFKTGGYKTIASYQEDFEDAEKTNPYFSLANKTISRYDGFRYADTEIIDEGYYKGADLVINSKYNTYSYDPVQENSTAITFTVPEGSKAILSFDYLLQKEAEAYGATRWMQCYAKIDGRLWALYSPIGGIGQYCHQDLLEPGEHRISFFASQYGCREKAKMWLDSICVDIVEEVSQNLNYDVNNHLTSAELVDGDFNRIKGSFRTLTSSPFYGEVSNAIILDGEIGNVPYTRWVNTNQDNKSFRIDVPGGKTAIYTRIPTRSMSYNNQIVKYSVPLFSYRDEGKTRWATDSWEYRPTINNDFEKMHAWPSDGVITAGPMDEPKEFSISARSSRSAYGDFTGITSVMVDSDNAHWKDRNFFLAPSDEGRKFYLQKDNYVGASLTLTLPEGRSFMRNLQLYYIENGTKVYVEKEAFVDSSVLSAWTDNNAVAAIINEPIPDKEGKGLVYKKGELISYNINYFDYEGDPSKQQYWKYTHTPFNDGPNPEAAVILDSDNQPINITGKTLNAPINRFYIDGKYTVEHWQEDNTTRPVISAGNPDYDKPSNVAKLTFYVEGRGGSAPWIESIKTDPNVVKDGDNFRFKIKIDDQEKDALRLDTEIYLNKELIYIDKKTNIKPGSNGIYPVVITDTLPHPAKVGRYEAICTVRDETGAGIKSFCFTVVSEGNIVGKVGHTDEWDRNRKKYNLNYFREEYNKPITYNEYLSLKKPRKRGTNVFWSGERFILTAEVAGKPAKVLAEIEGYPAYKAILADSGKKNSKGEKIYRGELWDRAMLNKWGKNEPHELKFLFTAEYAGGAVKSHVERVIVDSNTDYWLLHRLW